MSTALGLAMQISANTAQLSASIKDVNAKLDSMASAGKKAASDLAVLKTIEVSRVFATSVVSAAKAFTSIVAGSASAVASIDDLSKRTGVSTQALQSYQFAAEQSGVSVETFGKGIQKLSINLGEAQTGNSAAIKSFSDLGLSVAELSRLSPEAAFEKVAAAIAQLPNPAQQAAAAVSLFGKSGAELVPVFQEGAGFLEQMRGEAERLGLVLNKDQVQGLASLDDSIQKVSASFKAFGARVVAELAPQLIAAAKSAATFVSSLNVGDVANAASAALGGLVEVAKAAGNAFLIVYQATAPLAQVILPVIGDALQFIATNFHGAATGALVAAAGFAAYSLACGGAAAVTAALSTAITTLLSRTGIGLLVVILGSLAGAFANYALSAETASGEASVAIESMTEAIKQSQQAIENASKSAKDFGDTAKHAFRVPAEVTDKTLLQGTIDSATQAFRQFAQEVGALANVPKSVADAWESLSVAVANVNNDTIDQVVGQQLIAEAANEVLSTIQAITAARQAEAQAAEKAAEADKRFMQLAFPMQASEQNSQKAKDEKQRAQDLEAIQLTIKKAEEDLIAARQRGDAAAITAAERRLQFVRQSAQVAREEVDRQSQAAKRSRELAAMGLALNPWDNRQGASLADIQQAQTRGLYTEIEARFAMISATIQQGLFRDQLKKELRTPSQQALAASDVRTSDGIAQFMTLALGREDPAITQRREQLDELRKIRNQLIELGVNPVDILGGA